MLYVLTINENDLENNELMKNAKSEYCNLYNLINKIINYSDIDINNDDFGYLCYTSKTKVVWMMSITAKLCNKLKENKINIKDVDIMKSLEDFTKQKIDTEYIDGAIQYVASMFGVDFKEIADYIFSEEDM